MKTGKVYMVGAGPGDVKLITVKGLEAIQKAEVILYDRLANPKLLEYASANCELIYCGKLPDRHILRQEMINDLLVQKALEGKIVVRLKGGDPGVFGRVGEEAEALAAYQIEYEIVPGITSGIAAPLYAGIPVTHREFGESFAVVTAHDKSEDGQPKLDWKGLASGVDTIAFYMGISNLPFICENLIKNGKPATTPVILIQWGTFSRQKTLEGTLETIATKAKEEKFTNPAITLVGEIVSLRKKLNWFEKKPLFGRQILLARTGTGESQLAKELVDQGADVIEFPKWKKEKIPVDLTILNRIEEYDQIVFTSPESVEEFFQAMVEAGKDIRFINANLYACSVKSLHALKNRGLIGELESNLSHTGRMLIVGEGTLSEQYPNGDRFTTTKSVIDEQFLPIFNRMLEESRINTVLLPCSKAVKVLVEEGILQERISQQLLQTAEVVCMGEKTAQIAEACGVRINRMTSEPTYQAVVKELMDKEPLSII